MKNFKIALLFMLFIVILAIASFPTENIPVSKKCADNCVSCHYNMSKPLGEKGNGKP